MKCAGTATGFHRKLTTAGILFGVGILSFAAINPTTWLTHGFEVAIEQRSSDATSRIASASSRWTQPIAGTEDYWLGSVERAAKQPNVVKATHWRPAIAPGDKFKFGSGRNVRDFVVIDVAPLPEATVHNKPEKANTPVRSGSYLVTSHALNSNDFEILKLVIDRDTDWPAQDTRTRRAQTL